MKKQILFSLLILIAFTSCGKTYFTHPMRMRIQKDNVSRIQKVQFYNDRKITLVYKTQYEEESISGGKLKFEKGIYHYYIEIPKNTPGVAEHKDGNTLKVRFEEGEDRYLVFGNSSRDRDDIYQLYGTDTPEGFMVNFENKQFEVIEGYNAKLLVRKDQSFESEIDSRKLKGVKVQ